MARLATIPCIGCQALIKRAGRWACCSQCSALRDRFLARELAGVDPSAWVRGRNVVCSNRRITRAVVAYERTQIVAAKMAA